MALKGQTGEYFGALLLSLPIRFVSDTDNCILWSPSKGRGGYGFFENRGKKILAHRMMWEKANGRSIPHGWIILHTCDNPLCVNPRHLTLGTPAMNAADCNRKGRRTQAKLTSGAVIVLRALHAQGTTKRELATAFGVDRSTISEAVRGVTWKEVGEQEEVVRP